MLLAILFMWFAVAVDTHAEENAVFFCDEVDQLFVEPSEEDEFSSELLFSPSIMDLDAACHMQFVRTPEAKNANSSSGKSSGWMMPLRI